MEKFYLVLSPENNPEFNLAMEEFLLKNTDKYFVFLWQNQPSVIIGNNQNAYLEVNFNKAIENNVKIVRRLTGGGAVYHDLNNVNYSIISPYEKNDDNLYIKFTLPVIKYLKSLGVNAEFSGRNDITVNGKKISGNAQVVYKNRILHHGTLLFNTNLDALDSVLKENKLKIESKGIKSNRARVTNILDEMQEKISVEKFFSQLKDFLAKDLEVYLLTKKDLENIVKLKDEKYATFNWNIASSPTGDMRFTHKFTFGVFSLFFSVKDGKIFNAEIFGDFFQKQDIKNFALSLNGINFTKQDLLKAFNNIDQFIVGGDAKEITDKIFS